MFYPLLAMKKRVFILTIVTTNHEHEKYMLSN